MRYLLSTIMCSALLLNGCTSGSDDLAGIEGTGDTATAYGTITGFGSVYVNGVHFETDNASIEIDGLSAAETDLKVGMVVEIEGTYDSTNKLGSADIIRSDRVLEGVITSVQTYDWSRKSFQVLGQTVYVSEDATFTGLEFDTIAMDMAVSVSGFITTDGLITATHVALSNLEPSTEWVELEGYISFVDAYYPQFSLKDLHIDYSQAEFFGGNSNDLALDRKVEVVGLLEANMSTLVANKVVFKRRDRDFGQNLMVEGVVRERDTSASFYVNDTLVQAANARVDQGTLDDISNGSRVVVKGKFNNGALVAEDIFLKLHNSNRFRGPIEAVDPQAGTLTLFETEYHVNEYTAFEDGSQLSNRYINLRDLRPGEEIEIFATWQNNRWIATRIVRRDFDAMQPQFISGTVMLIEGEDNFYVMGIYVDVTDVNPAILDDIEDGDQVTVEGQHDGMLVFVARDIKIHELNKCNDKVFFDCNDGKDPDPRN